MKDSPYKGKKLEFNEIWHLMQVLKFYYDDIMLLTAKDIAEILRLEFGCVLQEAIISHLANLFICFLKVKETNKFKST